MSEASQMIEEAHEDVNLIWGWIVDEDMGDEVRVTVIATDFQEGMAAKQRSSIFKSTTSDLTISAASTWWFTNRWIAWFRIFWCTNDPQTTGWKQHPSILWKRPQVNRRSCWGLSTAKREGNAFPFCLEPSRSTLVRVRIKDLAV